ncbi:MAG: DUF6917 domain-containing protein [Candidatus Thorarchaeota archaeon]|jgi:hypothetical protein
MAEPYKARLIPEYSKITPKTQVVGKLIAFGGLRLTNRGIWLIHPRTRACPKNCILELTITDEEGTEPGNQINSVLSVGFLEVTQGGIVDYEDPVKIQGTKIGIVAGFSEIHYPNHLNIIATGTKKFAAEYIAPSKNATIVKTKFKLEDEVVFGKQH